MPLSPYVSQIVCECPDARLILAHPDGSGRFTLLSVSETAAAADFLSAHGVRIAGAVAAEIGGSGVIAASEPGCCELVARARLAALIEQRAGVDWFKGRATELPKDDSVAFLDALHKLEDPRA